MSVLNSKGVNLSKGVNWSKGVNTSNGVNWSYGVNTSYGVNWSYGVNSSDGVNRSDGVNSSYGVNTSYGILNSYGVNNALFLADKPREYSIFGVKVLEARFNEVRDELYYKLGGWYPKFNNAFELYVKSGSDWSKVRASEICDTLDNWEEPYEAWKDMPKEAIEYVKSLEEFDPKMFKRITGIDTTKEKKNPENDIYLTIDGAKYKLVD
jgi:hypothetical protein